MTTPSEHLTCAAVLVAAGSGVRLGAGVPKAFVTVAGRTLLEHACESFRAHPRLVQIVVVAACDQVERAAELSGLPVVPGGVTRQQSVAAGLAALRGDVDLVLVHDVARAFMPPDVVDAVLLALLDGAVAVVPVVALHDSIRGVRADGSLGGAVDRASLVAVQTPQGFDRALLARAHEHAASRAVLDAAGDDATLVEELGVQVASVPGSERGFKITTMTDLARAEAVLRLRSSSGTGAGADVGV